jgi:transcriptional regulator with XRE-family HTH domain
MEITHPLTRYLTAHGLSQAEFARRAGINQTVLCRTLRGERPRFSTEYALAILAATDGELEFEDLWRPRK